MNKKNSKYFPSGNDLNNDNFPFHWITQVHYLYILRVDHILKKHELDNSRRRVLTALASEPHLSISELSEMLITKMSTTTKIVYRLKEEGFIDTYNDPDDGRITQVVLTEAGVEITKKVNDLTAAVLEPII